MGIGRDNRRKRMRLRVEGKVVRGCKSEVGCKLGEEAGLSER